MKATNPTLLPYEYEPASNAYLMSLAAVVAGLPLPIVNVIAAFIFFMAKRRSSYAIRWHALQALLAQIVVMPFNSVAVWWIFAKLFSALKFEDAVAMGAHGNSNDFDLLYSPFESSSSIFWAYLAFVLLLNIFEFIAVISTAVQVRKGINVRWFGIASITDALCSKENRDPYAI